MCLMNGSPEGCVSRNNDIWFNRQKTKRVCGYASVQCVEAGYKECPAAKLAKEKAAKLKSC